MNPFIKKFLWFFIPFSALLFAIQYSVDNVLMPDTEFYYAPLTITLFLFLTTLFFYITLVYVHKIFPDKTGFAFLAFGMLKMFAAVVFLIPLIRSELENKIPATLFFFIFYFLYLFVETLFSVRLINKK